jgi:hypothetical protein
VRNKNVVDKRQFRQREFTDAGSRVNQNILINQKRGRPVLLSADTAGTAKYAQAHDLPSLRIYRWRPQAQGAENSIVASRRGAHAALSKIGLESDFNPKRRRF